jgi:hypothetical protein
VERVSIDRHQRREPLARLFSTFANKWLTIIFLLFCFVQGKYSLEVRSDNLAPSHFRPSFFLLIPYFNIIFQKNELHLRTNAALEALNVDKRL